MAGEGEEEFANFQKFQLKLYTVSNYVTLINNLVRVLFCFILWQMESRQRQKGKRRVDSRRRGGKEEL